MRHIHIDRLDAAALNATPFEHVIVEQFLGPESIEQINQTFPSIPSGGSYPVATLADDMTIKEVIKELDSREYQESIERKFHLDLSAFPKTFSLRGHTRAKDGRIHTDSKDKVVTVLLYLNRDWPHPTGKLRLLRDGTHLDNYFAEIPPHNGTLLIFRRSDRSWHGHLPFAGPRRALQMNWIVSERRRRWHALRHTLSAMTKRKSPLR